MPTIIDENKIQSVLAAATSEDATQ
ncbi:MAG: hypothetical protein ACD_69C00281G0001, partial [uncultured bacterium]